MSEPFDSPESHRIRLRGPWDFEWLKAPSGLDQGGRSGRLSLPVNWREAFGDAAGTVRLSRRFGRPGELDIEERVWLDVAAPDGVVSAGLNGEWLGTFAAGSVRFDVTRRLEWRNRLDLEVSVEEPPASDESVVTVALVFEPQDG